MLRRVATYFKNKFKENNLSWKLVCPPGIIAGIIQFIRSIILLPINYETPIEPFFIWCIRFSFSIIAIIFGIVCFFKPSKYPICTFPLCGWGLFMIYQHLFSIGFLLYIFGCFVSTKKEFLKKIPLKKSLFFGILITSVNFLCFFNGGWDYVKSIMFQEIIILFIIGSNILLMLPEINFYITTKQLSTSIEIFDLQNLNISNKDFKIMQEVLLDKNYKDIANNFFVSESYIKKTMREIFYEMNVSNKEEFLTMYKNTNFINIPKR